MEVLDYVIVEVIPHSGGVIVSALVDPRDGHGTYRKSETYYGYPQNVCVEIFIDRYAAIIVRD